MSATGINPALLVQPHAPPHVPINASAQGPARVPARRAWLALAFGFFNSARVVAYLPTLWAIHVSADSSQHSLWTWLTWLGANVTMAAWLYERGNSRVNRAVYVHATNAVMCAGAVLLILWYRV